jgi:hypothetical protein
MDRSRIACHVKPLLGTRAVAGLKVADMEKFHHDVTEGKTAGKAVERATGSRGWSAARSLYGDRDRDVHVGDELRRAVELDGPAVCGRVRVGADDSSLCQRLRLSSLPPFFLSPSFPSLGIPVADYFLAAL